jgi:hypothetical protein
VVFECEDCGCREREREEERQNPFAQARYGAIVQLAVFEAVNSITGDYHPYLGTVTAPPGASAEAAATEAAYRMLVAYFPTSKTTLDAELASSLGSIPDGQAKADGVAMGDAAASALISPRAHDGSSPPRSKVPGGVEVVMYLLRRPMERTSEY